MAVLWWRRDRIRRCVRCGEEWRVPYKLARRYRPSKWRVGVSPADHYGSLGGASVDYMLDNVRARTSEAYSADYAERITLDNGSPVELGLRRGDRGFVVGVEPDGAPVVAWRDAGTLVVSPDETQVIK